MTHETTISDLAYHLWQARGCPHGSAETDWAEAERQVRGHLPLPAALPAEKSAAAAPPAPRTVSDVGAVVAGGDAARTKKKAKR